MADTAYSFHSKITKVDATLGVVYGWAIVCKERNPRTGELEPFYDNDRDGPEHVTEEAMLKASIDFAKGARVMGIEHEEVGSVRKSDEVQYGTAVHLFALTEDIAKSMGIVTQRTGLMIGVAPDRKEDLARYAKGELTGFSIAGARVHGKRQPLGADPNDPAAWEDVNYVQAAT